MSVKTDTRVLTARATCNVCAFDEGGREAPKLAVAHAEQTGHSVGLNTTSFTMIVPD